MLNKKERSEQAVLLLTAKQEELYSRKKKPLTLSEAEVLTDLIAESVYNQMEEDEGNILLHRYYTNKEDIHAPYGINQKRLNNRIDLILEDAERHRCIVSHLYIAIDILRDANNHYSE